MSTVEITLKNDKGIVITALKEGNCVSVHDDSNDMYLHDSVYQSELTAQACLNYFLLLLGERGYKRE